MAKPDLTVIIRKLHKQDKDNPFELESKKDKVLSKLMSPDAPEEEKDEDSSDDLASFMRDFKAAQASDDFAEAGKIMKEFHQHICPACRDEESEDDDTPLFDHTSPGLADPDSY